MTTEEMMHYFIKLKYTLSDEEMRVMIKTLVKEMTPEQAEYFALLNTINQYWD